VSAIGEATEALINMSHRLEDWVENKKKLNQMAKSDRKRYIKVRWFFWEMVGMMSLGLAAIIVGLLAIIFALIILLTR